jgi:hypothetical protein
MPPGYFSFLQLPLPQYALQENNRHWCCWAGVQGITAVAPYAVVFRNGLNETRS